MIQGEANRDIRERKKDAIRTTPDHTRCRYDPEEDGG